ICIWAGISFAPVFVIGFGLVAGFIPPPAPGMSAEVPRRSLQTDHSLSVRRRKSLPNRAIGPRKALWRLRRNGCLSGDLARAACRACGISLAQGVGNGLAEAE